MLRQLGLIFFISSLSLTAAAETNIRYYDVEVILFEHIDAKNRQSEDWKARRLPPQTEQAELSHELGLPYVLEAESPYDRDAMFVVLPDNEKRLVKEAKLIDESKTRRILLHMGWRQPGLAKDQAVWVKFKHLIKPGEQDTSTLDPLNPATVETNAVDFLTGEKKFTPYIEGKIKVMLARYLHVDTDILYFAKPVSQQTTEHSIENENSTATEETITDQLLSQEPDVFLLKQLRRRIRSKELHYLDHPVIGMLLMITPYEKPEETGQPENAATGYKTLQ